MINAELYKVCVRKNIENDYSNHYHVTLLTEDQTRRKSSARNLSKMQAKLMYELINNEISAILYLPSNGILRTDMAKYKNVNLE